MHEARRKIVIVGGGAAGWITAGLIAAEHCTGKDSSVEVVLIESPDIPIIGVGEGTWPSMRQSLQKIGIAEVDLLAQCDASFKQGTEFIGWANGSDADRYYHPFSFPAEYASLQLANHWLDQGATMPFAEFVAPQAQVIAAGRAPKQANTPEYAFNVNYGYHVDAGKIAQLLHRHVVDNLGVTYISANVASVTSADNADIAALVLSNGESVTGDLFIDCTGQRSLLIGDHYGVELVSVKDTLFNDAAIAVQVPYPRADQPIASTTHSTATAHGWVWDIGLQSRRGMGHVYSSAHCDAAQAQATLRDYIAKTSPETDTEQLQFRALTFAPGYRREFWVNNCVAVGLSAGFVEPLEASALALVEQSAAMISQQLPADRELMSVVAKRFNQKMHYHWQRAIEFLKLHYVLSQRSESDYWRDCRDLAHCPDELADKLKLWQQQPPWHDDAPRVDELFPSASYQYVLYGMGFKPTHPIFRSASFVRDRQRVDQLLHANKQKSQQMCQLLPTNRDLISALTASRSVA